MFQLVYILISIKIVISPIIILKCFIKLWYVKLLAMLMNSFNKILSNLKQYFFYAFRFFI